MKKKILYLIASKDPGGAERILVDLARSFQLKNYDITVGHLGNTWLEKELDKDKVRNVHFGFSDLFASHKTEWIFTYYLLKFIKANNFDIIHSHLFGMIFYSSVISKLIKIPVIGTIHDKYYFMEKEHRRIVYKIVQLLGCHLVAVSDDIRGNISEKWKISKKKIETIYNGTDLSLFNISFDKNAKKKQFGLNSDDIIVISVGRLVKIKGHKDLIKAAQKVVTKNRKIKFIIVGDGPERSELEQIVKVARIEQHFIFVGLRYDVHELLMMSDIFVQSSLSEGLSCTIIEAIASGCPSIITDVGGNREIVTDGLEGYVVPVGNPPAIEKKLKILIQNEKLRKEMGKNAKEKARKFFSLESMVQSYEKIYTSISS